MNRGICVQPICEEICKLARPSAMASLHHRVQVAVQPNAAAAEQTSSSGKRANLWGRWLLLIRHNRYRDSGLDFVRCLSR